MLRRFNQLISLNFKIYRLIQRIFVKAKPLVLTTGLRSSFTNWQLMPSSPFKHGRRTRTYFWNGHNLLTVADRTRSTYLSSRSSVQSLHRRRSTMILARGWKLIRIEGNGWGNLATADCLKWRMVPSGTSLKTFSDTSLYVMLSPSSSATPPYLIFNLMPSVCCLPILMIVSGTNELWF